MNLIGIQGSREVPVEVHIPWWHHVAIGLGVLASLATIYTAVSLSKRKR